MGAYDVIHDRVAAKELFVVVLVDPLVLLFVKVLLFPPSVFVFHVPRFTANYIFCFQVEELFVLDSTVTVPSYLVSVIVFIILVVADVKVKSVGWLHWQVAWLESETVFVIIVGQLRVIVDLRHCLDRVVL